MVFLIWILLFLAVSVSGKRKAAVSLFMRIIVATRIRHKTFGSDNPGVNVRLTRKIEWRNFESRINRLKRDYNVGARNLNEYWGCYDAQCSQCYVTVQSRDNSLNNSGK